MNSIPGSPGEVSSSSPSGLLDSSFQLETGSVVFPPNQYPFRSEISYDDRSHFRKAVSEIRREDAVVSPDWRDDDPVPKIGEALMAIFLWYAAAVARVPEIDIPAFELECRNCLGWLTARFGLLPQKPMHALNYEVSEDRRHVWIGPLGGVVPKILRRPEYWSKYEAIRNSIPGPKPTLSSLESMLANLRPPAGATLDSADLITPGTDFLPIEATAESADSGMTQPTAQDITVPRGTADPAAARQHLRGRPPGIPQGKPFPDGAELKRLRVKHGLTQYALAKSFNVAWSAVKRAEEGKTNLAEYNHRRMDAIVKELRKPVGQVLFPDLSTIL
jgi:hypothetical protein